MKYPYLIFIFFFGVYGKTHSSLDDLHIKNWNDASTLAQKYLNLLIDNSINRIGNLNLKNLVQKINDKSEITFISLFDLNNQLSLGGRWINPTNNLDRIGADCYTEEATKQYFQDPIKQIKSKRFVVINEHSPLYQNLEPYYLHFTLLHEAICSLYGFSADDQYQMTSSLVFILGLLPNPDQLAKYLENNKWNFLDPFMSLKSIVNYHEKKWLDQKDRKPATGGGVTVGHGGGDPWSAYLKFLLMNTLHGKELFCEKPGNQQALTHLSCGVFLKKIQLYWDKLRRLNIETESTDLTITIKGDDLPLKSYRIRNNSDSSISLIFNRTYLKEIESEFKSKFSLKKSEKHIKIITEVFSELIPIWSNEQ